MIRTMLIPVLLIAALLAAPAALAHPGHAEDQHPHRDPMQIMVELQTVGQELGQVLANPAEVLSDESSRAEAAPKVTPVLTRMVGLLDEMHQIQPQPELKQARSLFLAVLGAFGDEAAAKRLQVEAEDKDPVVRSAARTSQLLVGWWATADNAAAQEVVVTQLSEQVAASPEDDALARVVMVMTQQGAASPELRQRIEKILLDDLKGPMAASAREHMLATRKLRNMENQPLVIEGVRHDGTQFSTADWKGRVILVDFWATWCGPCIAELPRVKKAYEQYHGQGLEILGISCDQRKADLDDFLSQNTDMPWPQLFDAANPGWHALATEYGINAIPTMFLIDRKGILRSVDARGSFEQLIPKLLAEPAE